MTGRKRRPKEQKKNPQEVMISLLGRMAFKPEEIKEIVTKGIRNPRRYEWAHNSCNGRHSVSQLARIAGVTEGTVSPILRQREEEGIIYEVESPGGRFYKKIYPI